MQIHQLLVGAASGDAITRIARATHDRLRHFGHSEIYAHHIDPTVAGLVRPVTQMGQGSADDVLIVRASIGDEVLFPLVMQRPERIVVAYHNITPAEYFDDVDDNLARLLRLGRKQLAELRPRVLCAWADSQFNATDLETMGYEDVEVVPPAVDPTLLLHLPPDPVFAAAIDQHAPAEVVLFVGQLLPHKRVELLIEAFHLLISHHRPQASLVIAGMPRAQRYQHALQHLVRSLRLPNVWLTGPVTDEQLGELYRRADVFATASAHEGFCLPVLEAMAACVPVIASTAGALPETVGRGGLLLDSPGPVELAEAFDLALENGVRAELCLAGRERIRDVTPQRALDRLEEYLESHLGPLR